MLGLPTGNYGWPALMPVVFVSIGMVCVGGQASARDTDSNRNVHKVVLSEEARVISALRKQNAASLKRSADILGSLVDNALAEKRKGHRATSCDFAAQSLTHVALLSVLAIERGNTGGDVFHGVSIDEANSFAKDMSKCEREISAKSRDHRGVAKILKALSKNGKS